MESDKIIVDIPCNDINVLKFVVDRFKNAYRIEIDIVGEEDRGGVNFISIASHSFTPNLIFEMGSYYSGYIRQLRDKKVIDW